jgi:septal ring factor EnvC (AmiA/AmiB activator)
VFIATALTKVQNNLNKRKTNPRMVMTVSTHGSQKKSRWAKFLEMLINTLTAGKSGNTTSRMHLTETEEEILKKRKQERNKNQRERQRDMAK